MTFLIKDYTRLETIQKKLINKTATSDEIQKFLELIKKSGNEAGIANYVKNIGFNSIDDFKKHLNNKKKNEDLITGLAVVGGAVLLAWILTRK